VAQIESPEERELILKLGYEVINVSARTPNEPTINQQEAAAYKELVKLLDLPEAVVNRLEADTSKSL